LIHAGVRDTIKMAIYASAAPIKDVAALNDADRVKWVEKNCTGAPVGQWEIATDGLTRPKIQHKFGPSEGGKNANVLEPGYRSDVLVVFPKAGDYCVIDEAAPASDTVNQQSKDRRLLATVHASAEGGGKIEDSEASLTQALVASAMHAITDKAVQDRVVADLKNGLALDLFVPHATVPDDEVQGHQELTFSIDISSPSPSDPQTRFGVDHRAYNMDRVDRTLKLGSTDEWVLHSTLANHPFHIHVNPFEIVKVLKDGADVSGPDSTDPDYRGLKGTWKDTIFVKQGYEVHIRTRYERYIGDFVLHCHILDHEDQGMMQNVRISLSGDGSRHGNH
jgi:L-ascorbate oxidase